MKAGEPSLAAVRGRMTEKEENSKIRRLFRNGGLTGLLFFQPKNIRTMESATNTPAQIFVTSASFASMPLALFFPKKVSAAPAHGADAAAFAALQQNRNDQDQGGYQKQNAYDPLHSGHPGFPP